jgi:hypothetical protein
MTPTHVWNSRAIGGITGSAIGADRTIVVNMLTTLSTAMKSTSSLNSAVHSCCLAFYTSFLELTPFPATMCSTHSWNISAAQRKFIAFYTILNVFTNVPATVVITAIGISTCCKTIANLPIIVFVLAPVASSMFDTTPSESCATTAPNCR